MDFPMTMHEATKLDLAPWGYIPGPGSFYCDKCQAEPWPTGNWPHSGDCTSTRCTQHAMEARLKDIRANEGYTTPPKTYLEFEHPIPVTDGEIALIVAAFAAVIAAALTGLFLLLT